MVRRMKMYVSFFSQADCPNVAIVELICSSNIQEHTYANF